MTTSKSVLRRLAVQKPELVTCEKCGKNVPADAGQTGEVLVGRQTHWEPAEYKEQFWCSVCIERAEHEAEMDDFDIAYARAEANGWSD